MRKPPVPCCVCGGAKPLTMRPRNKTCGSAACVSSMRTQQGQKGAEITSAKWKAIRTTGNHSSTWSPRGARVTPIDRGHRTVLQPCIAPYLATLAAASPTRTD